MDSHAFDGCKSLKKIILPEGLENIGDYAFSDCTALNNIYLGSSIVDIGSAAFNNCKGLNKVFLPKSLLKISPASYDISPFVNCSGTLDLYSDASKGTTAWVKYFGRVSYGVSYSEYLKIAE